MAWFEVLLFVYLYILRKTTTCLEEWPVFTVAIRSTVTFGKARIKSLTALSNIHDKHHRHRTYVRPSAQCRAVSGSPEHSLVSPAETDGERLRWQASRLGAVYAQVQETPTLLSERSWHTKGPGTDLAQLFAFALFHQYWNTSKWMNQVFVPLKMFTLKGNALAECSLLRRSVFVQPYQRATVRYDLHAD
jgi:hypothetical protein